MNITAITEVQLGSGLIGIGRKWGYVDSPVPDERAAFDFLSYAAELGITHFDTAASYGSSEARLGAFLTALPAAKRNQLIIATKFGDHWDSQKQAAYVDHSYSALKKSLERSLAVLGNIDLLYLHKAHLQALHSPDVEKSFAYAKALGVKHFGASVSDIEAAEFVLNSDFYSVVQLPYNQENTLFSDVIDKATRKDKIVVINRPFNMGELLYGRNPKSGGHERVEAFQFILRKRFNGFILTGTKSIEHLQENYADFVVAKHKSS